MVRIMLINKCANNGVGYGQHNLLILIIYLIRYYHCMYFQHVKIGHTMFIVLLMHQTKDQSKIIVNYYILYFQLSSYLSVLIFLCIYWWVFYL